MHWCFAVLATVFVAMLHVSKAYSDELAIATPVDKMSESFDVAPETSGLPLVGLRLVSTVPVPAASIAKLDLSNVAVALPSVPVQQICVRVTTQDARYVALNLYKISAAPAGTTSARLEPVSVSYEEPLKRYTTAQFALQAYVSSGKTCSPVAAMHLPEIDKPTTLESDSLALEISVNSRGRDTKATFGGPFRVSAQDESVEAFQVEVNCDRARALAGLAFDTICRLPLNTYEAVAGKPWTLRIVMNDGFDDSTHVYSVYLP